MNLNVPYRQIFLDDCIVKETTGKSPLKANQHLAQVYYLNKTVNNGLWLSTFAFSYLTFNKRYTGRKIYAIGLIVSIVALLGSNKLLTKIKSNCMKEFKCSDEHFNEYAWFYNYANLDYDNFYETERRNH